MIDSVSISVNGVIYEGWKSVSIQRSLTSISGSFAFTVADRWSESDLEIPFHPGDTCAVSISSDLVLTGYIDNVSPSFTNNDRSFSIRGRDKASDLVDCSIDINAASLAGLKPTAIMERICKPFGIKVYGEISGPARSLWSIQTGESVYENLDRLAKSYNFLLVSRPDGDLDLVQLNNTPSSSSLIEGVNLLEGGAEYSTLERFSDYIIKGQSEPTDENYADAIPATFRIKDEQITRYRPLLLVSESMADAADLKRRAQWERSVRRAKASEVEVKVAGWRQASGELWKVNQTLPTTSKTLGISENLLSTSVEFSLADDSGSTTKISLTPAEAFTPEPKSGTASIGRWKELDPNKAKK